jgi:YVTN family beta-propeller protein
MKNFLICLFLIVFSDCLYGQGTLLVANKNENTVSIISLWSDQVVGTIPVGQGPHDVAISPNGKIATIANYGNKQVIGNSITVIDVMKKEKLKDISLGDYTRPHGIEFINEDEVLVTIETRKVLLKVNIQTEEITEVAHTDQLTSHMVAYSRADKKAYVANIASGTVSLIDVAENKLIRQLEFKKGIEGIAVSPSGDEVWVANRDDSTVTAMSTLTFEKPGVMPAHQVAYRIKFLPNGNYVLVSNGISGNVSLYDAKTKKFIKDIDLHDASMPATAEHPNMPIPVGFAISRDSQFVFVSLSGYDQVAIIRTRDWVVEKKIVTGDGPDGIYYSPIELKQ